MKTEKVFALLFTIALIMKITGISGGDVLLVLFLSILALLYFPFSFYFFSDHSLKRQNLALSIIGGILLAIIPIGILFKLMYWQGADIQLGTGLFFGVIILIVSVILKSKSKPELVTYYQSMVKRTAVLVTVSAVVYILPYSVLINFDNRHDPELAKLKLELHENPHDEDLRNRHNDYVKGKKDKEESY